MSEMIHYAVITASGQIARTGLCPPSEFEAQAGDGERVAEHDGGLSDAEHYLVGDEVRIYPAKPGAWAVFDFTAEQWVDPRTPDEVVAAFELVRRDAIASANGVIAARRTAYITAMPGQDMIYLRKEEEAKSFLADATPDLANYPLIAAEIGITGQDGAQVAQVWLNMAAMWVRIAAALEAARLGAIAQLEAVQSADEAAAIVAALRAGLV